jgi:hypothetical protein
MESIVIAVPAAMNSLPYIPVTAVRTNISTAEVSSFRSQPPIKEVVVPGSGSPGFSSEFSQSAGLMTTRIGNVESVPGYLHIKKNLQHLCGGFTAIQVANTSERLEPNAGNSQRGRRRRLADGREPRCVDSTLFADWQFTTVYAGRPSLVPYPTVRRGRYEPSPCRLPCPLHECDDAEPAARSNH